VSDLSQYTPSKRLHCAIDQMFKIWKLPHLVSKFLPEHWNLTNIKLNYYFIPYRTVIPNGNDALHTIPLNIECRAGNAIFQFLHLLD